MLIHKKKFDGVVIQSHGALRDSIFAPVTAFYVDGRLDRIEFELDDDDGKRRWEYTVPAHRIVRLHKLVETKP